MTIESLPASRDNNFNLIRVVAAGSVIVSHSYPLSLGQGAPEPLQASFGFTLGGAAVTAFFAISGFFIAKSFDNRPLAEFLVARALRLLPALAVVSLVLALIVGPLASALGAPAYFASAESWWYAPRAVTLYFRATTLPGLFAGNPYPQVVDGPLWTLNYEVACYAGLTAAGMCGLLKRSAFPLFLAAYAACYLASRVVHSTLGTLSADMSLPFVLGMAAFVYRASIRYRLWIFACLLAATLGLTVAHLAAQQAWAVTIAYGCFLFGFARVPSLLAYNRVGDYSYGLYIYGWPAQQLVAQSFPGIGPPAMTAAAFLIALPCAMLSWHVIERPALELQKIAGKWPFLVSAPARLFDRLFPHGTPGTCIECGRRVDDPQAIECTDCWGGRQW